MVSGFGVPCIPTRRSFLPIWTLSGIRVRKPRRPRAMQGCLESQVTNFLRWGSETWEESFILYNYISIILYLDIYDMYIHIYIYITCIDIDIENRDRDMDMDMDIDSDNNDNGIWYIYTLYITIYYNTKNDIYIYTIYYYTILRMIMMPGMSKKSVKWYMTTMTTIINDNCVCDFPNGTLLWLTIHVDRWIVCGAPNPLSPVSSVTTPSPSICLGKS